MKVKVISENKKPEFKPFKLEVEINSLEDAGALAILYAGFTGTAMDYVMSIADVTRPKFPTVQGQDLLRVVGHIGSAAREELESQGLFQ